MNANERLERDIADALDAEVAGMVPARLLDDILSTTGRMRPSPRWLAFLKEPPMRVHHRVAVGSPTVRLVAVMALTMALALATAGAVAVGASLLPEPPKPPPFGLAATGRMSSPTAVTSSLPTPTGRTGCRSSPARSTTSGPP